MSEFQPVASIDRTRVKAAHDQSRLPRLHEMLPKVQVFPADSSKKISGYRLDNLSDPLVQVSLNRWRKGEQPGGAEKINEGTVTIAETEGFISKIRKKAMNVSFESRFNFFSRIGPEQLDEVHRMFDLQVATALVDTSTFSTETWAGTGALSTRASDHVPSQDINNKLRSTGVRRLATQMKNTVKLVCIMDLEVATILQDFTVYSGFGSTSGHSQHQALESFRAKFAETHALDEVLVYESVYDTARQGQTASRANIHNGVLWIGLLDRRMSHDLTSGDDDEGPDGGLAMAIATEPYLKSWTDEAAEMEFFAAAGDMVPITPRYTADTLETGIFFPGSENFT